MAKPTIDYRTREEYESRLRKIVLHSADALPDRVAEYIRAASEKDRWRAREQILKTFVPLVDHLPAGYVTFALGEMVLPPKQRDWTWDRLGELGIRTPLDYHPPAHVQGPFLRLLRTHEDEGLRLVHGLTNAATANWRHGEQAGGSPNGVRTPLPVILHLPTGPKELWGDENVYCWFRHTSVGPYAVISALMALEVWMEEQMAAGRDGGDLIAKVMASSQSVAVLGVCVAVSLAFPGRCLPGVLPFIAHPVVWRLDIHRFREDRRGSPIIDLYGRHKFINEQLAERNKRPQRGVDVRHLVTLAQFTEDECVKVAFEEAFASFGDELPFQFEEQKGQAGVIRAFQAEVEDYRGLLKRENFRPVRTSSASGWHYQSPRTPTEEESQRLGAALEFSRWIDLTMWAHTTFESVTPPDARVLQQACQAARSFHHPQDFAEAVGCVPSRDSTRQQAVAAAACAVASKAWLWAQQQGHAAWCRAVLLAAAWAPRSGDAVWDRETVFDLDHKVAAARGLTALVAQGAADPEVRLAVLSLVMDHQLQVVQAVFTGLQAGWGRDEVLCWNCLSLALTLAVVPGNCLVPHRGLTLNESGVARVMSHWQQHATNLERGEMPQLPAIEVDDRGFFLWDLADRALGGLPLDELVRQPEEKLALLRLADSLLGWTISENLRGSNDDDRPRRHSEAPWERNHFFLGWLADLARHLTPAEAESHVLAPVRATWPRLPRLTADLLHGLFQYQVARLPPQEPPEPQAVRTWEQVCRDLLGRAELARRADEDYLSGDWSAAVTMMVFVNHGMYLLKEEWQHVRLFSGIIDRWLEVVGTNHEAYRAFLTMLVAAFRHFSPAQVVGWLCRVASRSEDVRALWGANNGERTARVLHAVWQASSPALMADAEAFRQFSGLVDRLAVSGVALASVIQQELEGRGGY